MSTYNWEPERLKTLIDISGITQEALSEASGISLPSLRLYLKGASKPTVEKLIALADIFAVPLDYLAGRSSTIQNGMLFEHYQECFMTLRRTEFEELLLRKQLSRTIVGDGYEAPWPYNLLDDIFHEAFDHILSEDEIDGLKDAIGTISEREQEVLLLYYRDGKSLREIGNIYHLTVERIRQILQKGLRKLRHPSRLNCIRYGRKTLEKKKELDEREARLISRERILKECEAAYEKKIGKEPEKPENTYIAAYDEPIQKDGCSWFEPSQAFYELELSVRSYNCLRQKNQNGQHGLDHAAADDAA